MADECNCIPCCGPLKVFISAGDPSGDRQAAALLTVLRQIRPELEVRAIGGPCLQDAGAEILLDSRLGAVMGLSASLLRAPILIPKVAGVIRRLRRWQPDVAILVDWGGVNVRVARLLKKRLNIPILYFFPPRSWDRKARQDIAHVVDAIATPFPWSKHILSGKKARVEWVGHPLVDQVQAKLTKPEAVKKYELDANQPVVALLPGSRRAEIKLCLPILLDAAERMTHEISGIQFLIPATDETCRVYPKIAEDLQARRIKGIVLDGMDYEALQCADAAASVSGTATLEMALLGIPLVILYRGSLAMWLQYEAYRRTVMPIPYFGMPNLIADRLIIPELMQQQATPKNISRHIMDLLGDAAKREKMKEELAVACRQLGPPGAIQRTAEMVLDLAAYGPREVLLQPANAEAIS